MIDALTLVTRTFRELGAEGYRAAADHRPDELMAATHVPELTVRLGDLGLTPATPGQSSILP